MASNSLCVDLANFWEKYSEIERVIDLEHLKVKRDTPIHIRQAIWKYNKFEKGTV